jgi:hypothetical protein
MSEILYYRRSNGDEVSVEVGSSLHDRLEADGEYTRITEFEGEVMSPEELAKESPVEEPTGETTIVSLPIDGFDDLSIEEIVPHLEDLDDEDLALVEAYEIANKNRSGLLEAIESARSEDD